MTTKEIFGAFKTQADLGEALYRRGRAVFAGLDGERRNCEKGLAFLEAAALAGNADAQAEWIFFFLHTADDKEPNPLEPKEKEDADAFRKIIEKLAETGNPYAGLLWATGLADEENEGEKNEKRAAATRRKAMAALRRRAKNDALDAYYYYACLKEENNADDAQNTTNYATWWRKMRKAIKDARGEAEAERWLRKAAEGGYAPAVADWYGGYFIYQEKRGEKEAEKALQLLEKAAIEQEDARAALFLGLSYLYGRDGKKDRQAGIDWVYKAATSGYAGAMTLMGELCARDAFKEEGEEPDYENAVYWYRRAATSGDALANVKVGDAYRLGKGVEMNAKKAFFWYGRAVEADVAEGMRKLAWALYYGEGVEKNLEEAELAFRAAVEAGDGEAARDLGDLYALGDGFPKDDKKATAWFRKGAELGDAESIARLATRLDLGVDGGGEDAAETNEWLRKCYENAAPTWGDVDETVAALTRRLAEGTGGAINRAEAEYWRRCASEKKLCWYRRLAMDGEPRAMWELAFAYLYDDEVERDVEEGLRWLRKAAEKGVAEAAKSLGVEFFLGERVERDAEEALRWCRKAAELGDGEGASLVGNFYNEGGVVERDAEEALRWFRKAAELGESDGLLAAGRLFLDEDGLERDVDKALGYWREAVEAGNARAAFYIGWFYDASEDFGQAADPVAALEWFHKASEMGSGEAALVLGELYRDGDEEYGVEPDWNEAARYFAQAAETDEGEWCAYALFRLYDEAGDDGAGATLEKDDAEALRALRQAAERTSDFVGPKAKLRLGEVYERGELGVEANVDEARRLYREALATLDEISERNVARLFDDEADDEADIWTEARERLLNSATTDVEADLRKALEEATRRLSPEK